MSKNLITFILAIVVSVLAFFILPPILNSIFPCDGTLNGSCLSAAGLSVLIYFMIIPIVFGIFGAVSTPTSRLKQGLFSFGISLVVAILVFLPKFLISVHEGNLKAAQDIEDMKARYEANPQQYKQRPY